MAIRNLRLLRVLPAALILGCSTVATAAEICDAARRGDMAAVARLLKNDPKLINLPDEDQGATPPYHAVDAGNLESVRALLKTGAKVNAKADDSLKITALLLDQGANIRTKDSEGNSALHWAASVGNAEVVDLLLSKGADVEAKDSVFGRTPLHHAVIVRIGRNDVKSMAGEPEENSQLTLDAINKTNAEDKLKIVELLLAKGARPLLRNLEGATPIDAAGKFGTPEILAALKSAR